jgi:hypothetical protein
MSLPLLPSLAHRWLVAAVAAAGDGQNILPIYLLQTPQSVGDARDII